MRKRKKSCEFGRGGRGKVLEGVGGVETVIRIYYMKKSNFAIINKQTPKI